MQAKLISIVVPCYNESLVLPEFLARISAVAATLPQYDFEFLFVDDGSRDETTPVLLSRLEQDPRIKLVVLSRNYGHQRAIMAGLSHCRGDFVIVIDADLQDPPELIAQLLDKLEEGYDVVHAVRADRSVDGFLKRSSAKFFYAFMRRYVDGRLVENSGDYKAMTRTVLQAILTHQERSLFLRGLFAWVGYRQAEVPFPREARHAGVSKYPLHKVVRLARDAMLSNTLLPMRIALVLGSLIAAVTPLALPLLLWLLPLHTVEAVLFAILFFLFGLVLVVLGILGEYVGMILAEVQQRPRYFVKALHNVEPPPQPTQLDTAISALSR